MKRTLVALCLGMAAIVGTAFNASAAAAESVAASSSSSPRADSSEMMSSPKCSGTSGYGVIRYQVCFRYNCDSDSCNVLGYLGLINTATTTRTVMWDLDHRLQTTGPLKHDDEGFATLAAGEQRTIYSGNPQVSPICGGHVQWVEYLVVKYGSADWSSPISTLDTLFCA
ncbi:hypothetical protein [Amycolatopsis sp. cg9]|uniref:hypothetical protein n=1 Tax=Amycolatopsis sp. cg9 TaxID=3238801 RepID=UPI003523252F